jgi:polyhydroxyalkanoate synthesis regulator phasin
MSIERTTQGTFAPGSCGGPGRPSAKLVALHERHKKATIQETCEALQEDIPNLERQLADLDAEIFAAEEKFLERVAPTVKHRSEVAVELSRARVAVHYLSDPAGFQGSGELPADAAKREYDEIRRSLEGARRELASTPEPSYDRVEALADADKWSALHAYEVCRDRVSTLLVAEKVARKKAEELGIAIRQLATGPTLHGDPFAAPRRGTGREMVNAI